MKEPGRVVEPELPCVRCQAIRPFPVYYPSFPSEVWSAKMSEASGKTSRPWEPQHYRQELQSPEGKLPEGDLVFFLLEVVPRQEDRHDEDRRHRVQIYVLAKDIHHRLQNFRSMVYCSNFRWLQDRQTIGEIIREQ